MKEERYFYHPTPLDLELPAEEAAHATRVLRMKEGDDICIMDGKGTFYDAVITEASNHHCRYNITEAKPQHPEWQGHIHIAVAPTKNLDRMEWFVEKATEIGMNRLTLLDCRFSERRQVKTARLERIVVAAMKQSHKAWKPEIEEMQGFANFVKRTDLPARRFIAHCYDSEKLLLSRLLLNTEPCDTLVMIGPEGDFSIDEVKLAEQNGFQSISLGTSRLRTETAALAATHIMRLASE